MLNVRSVAEHVERHLLSIVRILYICIIRIYMRYITRGESPGTDEKRATDRVMRAISRVYLGCISGISRLHLGRVTDRVMRAISRLYLGYISRVYLGCISGASPIA